MSAEISSQDPELGSEGAAEGVQYDPDQPIGSFGELGLRKEVVRALNAMGFIHPMPVQREVVPLCLAGKDIIVQSKTGSGKTAAFGIPFAQSLLDPESKDVQALILAPTRELALQVADECGKIGKFRGLEVAPIYGGAPMGKQIEQLKNGVQIVGGTPGRVLDHLNRGTLKLGGLKVLVLDEADEMLSMGFLEEITDIIRRCPTDRQTLLFSATMPADVERIAQRYMREPLKIALSSDSVAPSELEHAYYMVSGMGRAKDLVRVLDVERPHSAIIFCNTREEVGYVSEFLRRNNYDAEGMSSDLSQRDRERVMQRAKQKTLKYLVATDIAARGIDVNDLSHVINYTFPESAEVYVHRSGRTGRAGKTGVAISLISPRELGNFYMLKLTYKIKPEERTLPSETDMTTVREAQRLDELRAAVDVAAVNDGDVALARRVWSSEGGEQLVAALVRDRLKAPAAPARAAAAPTEGAPTAASATEVPRTPYDPPRERDRGGRGGRGDRDRGGRGGRGERDRGGRGGRGGERDARPARSDAASAAPAAPAAPGKIGRNETIDDSDGREFWEAWVDSKDGTPAPAPDSNGAVTATASAPPAGEESGRGERRERRRRRGGSPGADAAPLAPGQVRLYLNLGERDGLTAESLATWLTEKGVTPVTSDLRSSHTYLIVEEASENQVNAALQGSIYGTRDVVCERAKA